MSCLETFTTRGVAHRYKGEFWNRLTCETFLPCASDLADPVAFTGSVSRFKLATLSLAEVRAGALTAYRTPQHVAAFREHAFFLHLQLAGTTVN